MVSIHFSLRQKQNLYNSLFYLQKASTIVYGKICKHHINLCPEMTDKWWTIFNMDITKCSIPAFVAYDLELKIIKDYPHIKGTKLCNMGAKFDHNTIDHVYWVTMYSCKLWPWRVTTLIKIHFIVWSLILFTRLFQHCASLAFDWKK